MVGRVEAGGATVCGAERAQSVVAAAEASTALGRVLYVLYIRKKRPTTPLTGGRLSVRGTYFLQVQQMQ